MSASGSTLERWGSPPPSGPIAPGAVHVWRLHLDAPEARRQRCAGLLSADERKRAARFHFERDRRRYALARGYLRQVLSRYTGTGAAALRFDYGPQGKPFLADAPDFAFNLSHSHECALIAVGGVAEIGVDVEWMRPDIDLPALARRFFAAAEVAELEGLPETQRVEGFFRCWTRKEAFIKAVGQGLSCPLDRFRVTLTPGAPAALQEIAWAPDDVGQWTLANLEPGAGYAGAVMARGPITTLRGIDAFDPDP